MYPFHSNSTTQHFVWMIGLCEERDKRKKVGRCGRDGNVSEASRDENKQVMSATSASIS
jgi:hypothetical protein